MKISKNGTETCFEVRTIEDARGIIQEILSKYKYIEETPGRTWGAVTSFDGYNDPDETGYLASETWSIL